MEKIALISLGCAKNLVDSEVMLGYLKKDGYGFTSKLEEADVIIINTCGFIKESRKESFEEIKRASKLKKSSRLKRIIVTGCYVEREKKELKETFPEVDSWLGVRDFDKIGDLIRGKTFLESDACFLYSHTSPRELSTPPSWTYIKISEGCSHKCSFCAIPLIKGPYRSREINSIVEEAEMLTSRGIKEINLISQDSTYFLREKGKEDGLVSLLKELLKIRGIEWIRILYGYPEEIDDELLEIIQEEKICSYLDLPFQHSHPRILRKMKRGMEGKKALKFIEKIRKKIPDIALRTSLIVGFPGEGNEEFEDLKLFVQEARLDHIGVFTYSRERGTEAYLLGDPVKESVKEKRKRKIMELQAEISYVNNSKYLNQKVDVLIEGMLKEDETILVGRGEFQAPEVDGVIFVEANQKAGRLLNKIHKVEIVGYDVYDLYGKIV